MRDVTFFMSDAGAVERYEKLDPDRDWEHFGSGIPCWIAQTYLRLRAVGTAVTLSARAPRCGIVVLHADDLHNYFRTPDFSDGCLIVCVRADRQPQWYADVEIVQNAHSAKEPQVCYLPLWPQPGLIRRESSRGTHLERLVFKGAASECHPMFESPQWAAFLADSELQWVADRAQWQGPKPRAYNETRWNDYSDADLVIGIRKDTNSLYPNKPASKLVNAWLAGVPAILGPEIAYRELRRSPLDYIEAAELCDVIAAVTRLRRDPSLYRSMVENGFARARHFEIPALTQRWQHLLFETIPRFLGSWRWRALHRMPVGVRARVRRLLTHGSECGGCPS